MQQPENQSKKHSSLFNDIDGGKIKEMGIWDDDYERFMNQRAKQVASALNEALKPDDT